MSEPKLQAAPEPADIAGRYQIVKKLGAGAFGTVYKARDRVLGRMVAIKTIRLDGIAAAGASLQELLERFEREAQVSAQLRHPNIVTIHDIGKDGELSYLAMEFIDGMGLERIIAADKRLGVERAAGIAAQVADALDFAHKHGVVHRDIKPANIMIEDGDRVKVTDFGIAKVTDSGDHLTMTGSLLGTPSYMSPEQARGLQLDGRSDLFAVGCVLYEMVAGQKAFRGDSITGLIFKIITEEPVPIQQMVAGLPDDLVRIISRALAKTPDARYQTGRELKDDLDRLTHAGFTPTVRVAETPTEATPPAALATAVGTASPTLSASPTVAGPAATQASAPVTPAAATVVTPGVPAAPTLARPPAPAPAPPARPRVSAPAPVVRKSSSAGIVIGLLVVGFFGLLILGAGGWYFFLRPSTPTVTDGGSSPTPAPVLDGGTHTADGGGTQTGTDTAGTATGTSTGTGVVEDPSTANTGTGGTGNTGQTVADRNTGGSNGGRPTGTGSSGGRSTPHGAGASSDGGGTAAIPNDERGGTDPGGDVPVDDGGASDAEAGRRLADTYRSKDRGFGGYGSSSGSNYGASGRFRERPRVPAGLVPVERAAAGVLLQIANAQERYKRQASRYGSFDELREARTLLLAVPPAAKQFMQANYQFALTVKDGGEGFEVHAQPRQGGLRPLVVDDSGFVLVDE
jgi:hypothetical protein